MSRPSGLLDPLHAFVECIPHAAWVARSDGTTECVNRAWREYTGLTPDQAAGGGWHRAVHPDDAPVVADRWARAVMTGGPFEAAYRLRRADGEYRWHIGRAQPQREDDGTVVRWFGTCTDVDAQRRAEDALRASEARFRTVIERSLDAVNLYAADGTVRYASPASARLMGYSPDELPGTDGFERVHPDDRPRVRSTFAALTAGPETTCTATYRVRHRDGGWRWLEGRGTNLLDEPTVRAVVVTYRDVTREREAEEALRASEARFRATVENGFDAVVLVSPDGVVRYASPSSARIVGYTPGELVGRDGFERVHPDDRAAVWDRFRDLLDTPDGVGVATYRLRHKDESWRWIEARWSNLLADPAVGAVVTSFRDVTARRRAEGLLALQSSVLEALTTEATLGHVLAQLVGGVEGLAADLLCSVLLLTEDGRLLDGAGASLPTEYRGAISGEPIGPAAGSCGTAAYRREAVVVTDIATDPLWAGYRDLALRHGLRACWSTPVFGRDGRVLGTFAVYYRTPRGPRPEERALIDTATHLATVAIERRRDEESLRLRDRAIRAVSHGIVLTDPTRPDNPIIYASPGFERLTGYREDETLGRNCRFLQGKETDPAAVAEVRRAVAEGRECAVEVVNYRKDGTKFWNALRVTPVRDDGGGLTHFVGVQVDVTARRQMEDQLRQAQKMEAVGKLAGGVAHDFNNLLTVITGYSDVLLTTLPPQGQARSMVEEVKKAGDRAAALTGQLLAFGRKQILRQKVLDLNGVMADLGRMLGRLIGEDVELAVVPGPQLMRVTADAGQVEQVVMNLAVNARDAMPTGGRLTIETRNVTLARGYTTEGAEVRPGPYVQLTVADTGCGMTDEVKARLFEPFFTTKEVGKGTGLGLAVVHGIVATHGGHVEVESRVGQGTVFRVYFPAITAEVAAGSSATRATLPRGTETILVVEDEEGVRALTRLTLQRLGYTVLVAAGGAEGIAAARAAKAPVDLLLTDVVMPGMNGRAVAEQLLATTPGLKVLYTSGYTDDAVVRYGVEHERANFLPKPYTPAVLAMKVREVLDQGG